MQKNLLCGALMAIAAAGWAQTSRTVTFTPVLQVVQPTDEVTNGGTYIPNADKFISVGLTNIRVYNGDDGHYESDLSTATITTSGAGFQAATATEDGYIYVLEDGGSDIWRWESVNDPAPVKVFDTGEKYWYGYTSTVGNQITVGFSSPTGGGPATFFTDSFPFFTGSFNYSESAAIETKMGLAFNKAVDVAWTVADTARTNPLKKWNKSGGVWMLDTTWESPKGGDGVGAIPEDYYQGGPLAYDEDNNVLLALTMQGLNLKVHAYDGTTGADLGWHWLATTPYFPPRGGGAWVDSNEGSGTFYAAARGESLTTGVNLYKFDYTVVTTSDITDWALYQ